MQLLQTLDAREFITALIVKGGPPPQYTWSFVLSFHLMMTWPKHIVEDKRTLSVQSVVFALTIKTDNDLKNTGMTISLTMEQVPNTIAKYKPEVWDVTIKVIHDQMRDH